MMRAAVALAMLLGLGSVSASSPALAADAGRTYYERLPLDTPEHAARAFAESYATGDYWAVYLILSQPAQNAIQAATATLNLEAILKVTTALETEDLRVFYPDISEWESLDVGWLFDHVMVVARDKGMLPIRIDPGAAISMVAAGAGDASPRVTVSSAAGILILELVRSPAGHWRVQSAMPEGGERTHLPWGLR